MNSPKANRYVGATNKFFFVLFVLTLSSFVFAQTKSFDEEIYKVLEQVDLKNLIDILPGIN